MYGIITTAYIKSTLPLAPILDVSKIIRHATEMSKLNAIAVYDHSKYDLLVMNLNRAPNTKILLKESILVTAE